MRSRERFEFNLRFDWFDRWVENSVFGKWVDAFKTRLAPAPLPAVSLARVDVGLAVIFGEIAVLICMWTMSHLPDAFYSYRGYDLWFQADQPRVFMTLIDRAGLWHYRDNVHPLFSLLAFPFVELFRALGLSPLEAAKALFELVAFFTAYLLFLTFRLLHTSRFRSALGCAAFLSSSTFFYWSGVIETYALSGLSAILCVYLMVRSGKDSTLLTIFASVISMSMVITNWTLGLVLTFTQKSLGKVLRYSFMALLLCVFLSVIQRQVFPMAGYFFSVKTLSKEQEYVSVDEGKVPKYQIVASRLQTLVLAAAVAPQPYAVKSAENPQKTITNQSIGFSLYGPFGLLAVTLWMSLIAICIARYCLFQKLNPVILGIAGFLVGQVLLHAIYGEITFLYAADYFALLIIVMCAGEGVRWGRLQNALLLLFIIFAGAANAQSFLIASQIASQAVAWPSI